MSIFVGSMNHTPSGRRKKKVRRSRKPQNVFKAYKPQSNSWHSQRIADMRSVPSATTSSGVCASPVQDFHREVSSKYTVSIAYNKGAYQVISSDDIDKIGRS